MVPDSHLLAASLALLICLGGDVARGQTEPPTADADQETPTGLHQRLEVSGLVGFAYDSIILQEDEYQTLGSRCTRCAYRAQQRPGMSTGPRPPPHQLDPMHMLGVSDFMRAADYRKHVLDDYGTPVPGATRQGLPLNLELELLGRVAQFGSSGLWLGYSFEQLIMLYAEAETTSSLPPRDAYNFQKHTAALRVSGELRDWLEYSVRAEGFASFSGLAQYTPFQYGAVGEAEFSFNESKQWKTRLVLTDKFRRAFSQELDSYLDGNLSTGRLAQELTRGGLSLKLGYQFSYDSTGVFSTTSDVTLPSMTGPMTVGTYTYHAPLSYQGHQVFLSGALTLLHGVSVKPAFYYEYRRYGEYYATYQSTSTMLDGSVLAAVDSSEHLLPVIRKDHLLALELSITKSLPRQFALELGYSLRDNISNVANSIDNRNFLKHIVQVRAIYEF